MTCYNSNGLIGGILLFNLLQDLLSSLKEGFCTLFFCPRTRPRTSLQCFALDSRCSEAKHCRDVLGRVLGRKN